MCLVTMQKKSAERVIEKDWQAYISVGFYAVKMNSLEKKS